MAPRVKIEFDEQKNQKNIQKHGISFQIAAHALSDPDALIEYDEIHSVEEDRFYLLGQIDSRIIFLVFTMRGNAVRLISARPATKREVQRYYERER